MLRRIDTEPEQQLKIEPGCTCDSKVGDGYYDLSCPVHDAQEPQDPEIRRRGTERILAYAKTLDW